MLDLEQKKAVNHFNGPGLVLAGPGSGKTTVITYRVSSLIKKGVDPRNILVLTFTRKAAANMKKRFLSMSPKSYTIHFSTFHSFFYSVIKSKMSDKYSVINEKKKHDIIKEILVRRKIATNSLEDYIEGLIGEISRYKGTMDKSNFSSDFTHMDNLMTVICEYNKEMKNLGLIDFDDIQNICMDMLRSDKKLLSRLRSQYLYILIDEFQDINEIQYSIIKKIAQPNNNLFVVGDDDQSIYGFRGSSPEIMLGFNKEFRETKIYKLFANYRSLEKIVELSKKIIKNNSCRYDKDVYCGNKKLQEGIIDIRQFLDFKNQMEYIIKNIKEKISNGISLEQIAILVRNNNQIESVEKYLNINKIPTGFIPKAKRKISFYEKDIAHFLKAAYNEKNIIENTNLLEVINKPDRCISREAIVNSRGEWDGLMAQYPPDSLSYNNINKLKFAMQMLPKLKPDAAIMFIRKALNYEDYIKYYCRENNLNFLEIIKKIDIYQYEASKYKTIKEFFDSFDNQKIHMDNNGINIMTFHSSKGLEFDAVYLIDINEDIIPSKQSVREGNIQEERRLFYVGVTRAKEYLGLFSIKKDGSRNINPSIFLEEIYNG